MNIASRFNEQYRANLDAYRRRGPRRILWLVATFFAALLVGGILHATKSMPILFYATLTLLGLLTILLVIWKVIRLIDRTREESRYIFQTDIAAAGSAVPQDVDARPLELGYAQPVDAVESRSNTGLITLVAILVLPLVCLGGGGVLTLAFYWASWKQPSPTVFSPYPQQPGSEIPDRHRDAIGQIEQSTRSLEDQLRQQQEQLRRQSERYRRRP